MMPPEEEIRIDIKSSRGSTFKAIWNGKTRRCRGCGELIGFAKTEAGKLLPFDPPDDDSSPCEPHFATCPKAGLFRKGKK